MRILFAEIVTFTFSFSRVYIIFTVEDVIELLNCSRQKAIKNLAELDSEKGIGLIEKKRLGLGRPNVIYVKNFIIKEGPEHTLSSSSNHRFFMLRLIRSNGMYMRF